MTTETTTEPFTGRGDVIKRIRTALRRRSGKAWSVTGGHGTAWGWIRVDVPPAQRTWSHRPRIDGAGGYEEYDTGKPGGLMGPVARVELAALLGLDSVHHQGVSIPSSGAYYREYIDRAEGRAPSVVGTPYWD